MNRICSVLLVGLLLGAAGPASGVIVYSGLQNIPIPTTFDGVYLDLDSGATGTAEFNGWDINPFFGGSAVGSSADFQPAREGTGNMDTIIQLDLLDMIDSSLFYSSGETGSSNHLGAPGNFQDGAEGYLGFRFVKNDASGPYYGWMRLTLTANTPGGLVHDWAWEDSGAAIPAGVVPEPTHLMLSLLGFTSMLLRRQRRRA